MQGFYKEGYSIEEIAVRMNMPYSTVRTHLVNQGVTLRKNKSVSVSEMSRQTFKNSAPPPYGFCYFEGKIQKDPREFPILQTIEKQMEQGRTPTEIAKHLSSKKLKTRHGKKWQQAHVFNIVRRIKSKTMEVLSES